MTCLARSHSAELFAVGHSDGAIVLWSAKDGTERTTFQGHKGAVTALAFDADDARLASGARDTTVIVWDVVAERGLYRYGGATCAGGGGFWRPACTHAAAARNGRRGAAQSLGCMATRTW